MSRQRPRNKPVFPYYHPETTIPRVEEVLAIDSSLKAEEQHHIYTAIDLLEAVSRRDIVTIWPGSYIAEQLSGPYSMSAVEAHSTVSDKGQVVLANREFIHTPKKGFDRYTRRALKNVMREHLSLDALTETQLDEIRQDAFRMKRINDCKDCPGKPEAIDLTKFEDTEIFEALYRSSKVRGLLKPYTKDLTFNAADNAFIHEIRKSMSHPIPGMQWTVVSTDNYVIDSVQAMPKAYGIRPEYVRVIDPVEFRNQLRDKVIQAGKRLEVQSEIAGKDSIEAYLGESAKYWEELKNWLEIAPEDMVNFHAAKAKRGTPPVGRSA